MKSILRRSDGTAIEDSAIMSCVLHSTVANDSDLTFGAACADYVEITTWGSVLAAGDELAYSIIDEDGTEVPQGVFICEKPERASVSTYKVTAYDRMVNSLERPAKAWLQAMFAEHDSYTLFALLSAACDACGVELGSWQAMLMPTRTVTAAVIPADEISFRQLVSQIAESAGCFAHFQPDGKLSLRWYAVNDSAAIAPEHIDVDGHIPYILQDGSVYITPAGEAYNVDVPLKKVVGAYEQKPAAFEVPIVTEVKIGADSGTATAAEGNAYQLNSDNPFLSAAALPYMESRLQAMGAYTPLMATLVPNTALRAGDIVTGYTADGDSYTTVITELTGGAQTACAVTSTGNENRQSGEAVAERNSRAASVSDVSAQVAESKAEIKAYSDSTYATVTALASYKTETDGKIASSEARITATADALQAQVELEAEHYSEAQSTAASLELLATDYAATADLATATAQNTAQITVGTTTGNAATLIKSSRTDGAFGEVFVSPVEIAVACLDRSGYGHLTGSKVGIEAGTVALVSDVLNLLGKNCYWDSNGYLRAASATMTADLQSDFAAFADNEKEEAQNG